MTWQGAAGRAQHSHPRQPPTRDTGPGTRSHSPPWWGTAHGCQHPQTPWAAPGALGPSYPRAVAHPGQGHGAAEVVEDALRGEKGEVTLSRRRDRGCGTGLGTGTRGCLGATGLPPAPALGRAGDVGTRGAGSGAVPAARGSPAQEGEEMRPAPPLSPLPKPHPRQPVPPCALPERRGGGGKGGRNGAGARGSARPGDAGGPAGTPAPAPAPARGRGRLGAVWPRWGQRGHRHRLRTTSQRSRVPISGN